MRIDRKFIRVLKTGYYDNMEIDKNLGFLKQQKGRRCMECGKPITDYSRCRECYFRTKDEAYL